LSVTGESITNRKSKSMSMNKVGFVKIMPVFTLWACAGLQVTLGQPIPPGVPEPGLVIWGTVVNQTNTSQPITINTASWSVTDGSKTAVYSSASRPATRTVTLNGQSYYVLQVPFDTRQIGTATLADPATVGLASFELKASSPPTYTLVPTINGALASVRSIDGAPASGGTVPVAGFTSVTRGRTIRVDLSIIPTTLDYTSWATGYFGNPNLAIAAQNADPDGDGMSNLNEYLAGTNPTDATSALRILQLTIQGQPPQAVVGWQSVAAQNYLIETAAVPQGPWTTLGTSVASAGPTTQTSFNLTSGEAKRFYRVRLAP
jgi:hypothetical protein